MSRQLAMPEIQDEHRSVYRFTCEVPTTCQPPSAWCKDPWPATIRDISNGGLSLTLQRRFEKGSGLAIELPTEDGTPTTVLARVAHVQTLEPGIWLLGCTFISELSDEEVQLVLNLDPVHEATLSDGGSAAKSSVNGVLFQALLRTGEVLRWYVKRLDMAGTWPLPRDRIVSMRIGGAQAAPLELKVKDCKLFGSYWIINCKFAVEPRAELLQMLANPAAVG